MVSVTRNKRIAAEAISVVLFATHTPPFRGRGVGGKSYGHSRTFADIRGHKLDGQKNTPVRLLCWGNFLCLLSFMFDYFAFDLGYELTYLPECNQVVRPCFSQHYPYHAFPKYMSHFHDASSPRFPFDHWSRTSRSSAPAASSPRLSLTLLR